jgi:predicted nucleic acid-binding protein
MFVDTNVLVYASVQGAPNRDLARAALVRHASSGEPLRISRQVLREFVAVITRPQTWARAQSCADAAISVAALAQHFDVLEDVPAVWDNLLDLCRRFEFGGRQVHDANIVATMLAHRETRLLTFNVRDFTRFAAVIDVTAV